MHILLFSILLGILTPLILVAPPSYYPLLFTFLTISLLIIIFSRKYFTINYKILLLGLLNFIVFYALCSFIIFNQNKTDYPNFGNVQETKKAVIFYSEGEMEKYSPFFADYFFKDKNILLKPLYCYKIKKEYSVFEVNEKNKELTKIAQELKKALLNYMPYYYYIAFEGYIPNIRDSIFSAVKDGCKEIYIINYTSKEIELKINKYVDLNFLRDKGINIKITKPIYESDLFINYFVNKINNLPVRYQGILIYDNETKTSSRLKERLVKYGYKESGIIISKDIKGSFDYFKSQNFKDILFLNLTQSSSGIEAEKIINNEVSKYTQDFRVHGIKSWGFDIELVKACIKEFKEIE
ncbi:hypothetical protein ABG79_01057 [Caloramator mitchellensis]|uniref:Uncharacterized protein n=1 Tax=Caloramator mitchellensis TaxID=908809 RepID=A0A0R3JUK6_CALMK|nr:hypothetical protein [Caloramator mitchellensis]KRQ87254.1 hypothetical protein ABG79_01057 [Caloramator mitchellensis]